jgi:hypothetical protein
MRWSDEQARLTLEARLQLAGPDEVYRELQRLSQEMSQRGRDDDFEATLISRNEPLINLGLACFGTNQAVFKALYNHSLVTPKDAADNSYLLGLRIGCLSNVSIREKHFLYDFPRELVGEAEIVRIIVRGEKAELEALLCNPQVSETLLENLYRHAGPFASIMEERWLVLLAMSRNNERLVTEKDHYDSPDTELYGIHRAIFELLERAPTKDYWLRNLYELVDKVSSQQLTSPESIDVVLARWTQIDLKEYDGKPAEGYWTSLPLKDEFRCFVASLYGRGYVNGKLVIHGSPADPDVAKRCAYYGNAPLSENEMKAGNDRDKEIFAFAAMNNSNVLLNVKLRAVFEDGLFLNGDLTPRYQRNLNMLNKRWPRSQQTLGHVEATSADSMHIEIIKSSLERIERQLATTAHSQQLIIAIGIGLALFLYFKH